jgi:hypothetical protein
MDTLHVRPEENGVDTRSELIKFYDEHYSANIMHLVVYGKENLDKTQGLVEALFQGIRNTNQGIPRFPGQPCTLDHLQVFSSPYFSFSIYRKRREIDARMFLKWYLLWWWLSLVLGSREGCSYNAGSRA